MFVSNQLRDISVYRIFVLFFQIMIENGITELLFTSDGISHMEADYFPELPGGNVLFLQILLHIKEVNSVDQYLLQPNAKIPRTT